MLHESILAPYVRKLERRRRLDDAERAALLNLPHRVRQLDRSAYISREGEDTKNCQILLSGFAQSSRTDARGARALLALHMEGEPLNICGSADEKSPCDVQALSPLTIASIPNDALISLGVSYPSIAIALWRLAARNASVLSEWLMNVGRRDARGRISHLICEIAVRQEAAGVARRPEFVMPLTQEQLGDATGLTAVHVNRILQHLSRDGLLRWRSGRVTIGDWEALKAAGEFRPGYLQLAA
ncbi:MAG: Crp/Fnr family transcriptional regulator [Proteobacteria bacterium]|nr:Crp/Fnr family transcriptional regulator [Pseudomonadota bacterium]